MQCNENVLCTECCAYRPCLFARVEHPTPPPRVPRVIIFQVLAKIALEGLELQHPRWYHIWANFNLVFLAMIAGAFGVIVRYAASHASPGPTPEAIVVQQSHRAFSFVRPHYLSDPQATGGKRGVFGWVPCRRQWHFIIRGP